MDFEYKHLLPEGFDDQSRVWIYQSSRLFSMGEALQIEDLLNTFVENWKSHGAPVKGFATLFFGQFVVFIADETAISVGGCSTDSSVRLVKDMEGIFKVNFFDRTNLAFALKGKVQTIPMTQLNYALENKFIDSETVYFNNTVLTLGALKSKWMIPISESWLKAKISLGQ